MAHRCSSLHGKLRSLYICTVVLGILLTITTVHSLEYRRVSRKLFSSPEPELDSQFSNEDLRKLLSILEGTSKEIPSLKNEVTSERASAMQHNANILPELMRSRPSEPVTTTTAKPPVTRVTTRRFYRRLRRKTTTAPTATEVPSTPSTTLRAASEVESSRMLPSGPSPSDILQQLSLLNGILGALNSTAQAPTNAPSPPTANANDNATPVPDFLALFTGAKNKGEASSTSEVVVPPPPPSPSSSAAHVEDPATALALLNLFSNSGGGSKEASENSNNAANNLLNLVAQSQQAAMQPTPSSSSSLSGSDSDATAAALTKLLLQNAVPASPVLQSNSIVQSQVQQSEASAPQLHNLLGLLGTLGAAGQQSQSGNINQLFNLGGDQVAQAQQNTNSLAQLFGQQTQQQQVQAQNLLSLLGGNQGNQAGFSLASLLAPQAGNSIPGLGLLSTMSSLGSSIFSTVSNIFGGSNDGKPRVRGKGVDTRVGLGYRLGNIGDAQVVWDIGPQLFTDPLRNEARPYTQKRESGPPAGSHYFQTPSATATEKEVQQIEAKRRMVQAAIQDHYRGDHFASVYPKPSQRSSHDHYDYSNHRHYFPEHSPSVTRGHTDESSSSSFFTAIPFADHIKGFWSGLTSGITGSDNNQESSTVSKRYNGGRAGYGTNLIKRSSPDYTEYEPRAYNPRQLDIDIDDPTHSTLTEYERMLMQHGKDIGVANTKHGVIEEEPQASGSGFFSRWFKGQTPTSKPAPSRVSDAQQHTEWDFRSNSNDNDNFQPPQPSNSPTQKSVKKSFRPTQSSPSLPPATASSPYGYDGSFLRRNTNPRRRNGPRPQKRRSHNPFRNWLTAFKQSAQRPRSSHPSGGFGRRHFKRPSVAANPKLQHFTNTNKDLMMADANDDFVESAGEDSYNLPAAYEQPVAYSYANEFPDVSLTMPVPPRRLRPTNANNAHSNLRASLSQREKIVEPALLYDHLEVSEPSVPSEIDESFHQRNKVVVNSALKNREKQKILGTAPSVVKTPISTLSKIQRLRLQNKHRGVNATGTTGKQKIVVKIKSNKGNTLQTHHKGPPFMGHKPASHESTTALPSVLSTISSIFSGTTKPKLLNNLIHNATSMFPSISSIRILPRKKKKEQQIKTKLTLQNGRPAVVALPDPEDDDDDDADQDPAADGEGAHPVVQVGHDMSFADLQNILGGAKNNGSKPRRFRIRVKESVFKGEGNGKDDKERKDSDEDEEDKDGGKDIFVDIESGEVSVLKPIASLVSFNPKKEEASDEEEIDYYEDEDGDGVADMDMHRKEHIFAAIQKELVRNFEKMKKAEQRAEAKKRRKQELAEKGMDESIDDVTKYFDLMQHDNKGEEKLERQQSKLKPIGGLSM